MTQDGTIEQMQRENFEVSAHVLSWNLFLRNMFHIKKYPPIYLQKQTQKL